VALRFLSWESPEVSVFWWLLLAFFLGAGVSAVGFALVTLRLRMQQRRGERELNAARKEVDKLRQLTLRD
jgi:hypothetical protein